MKSFIETYLQDPTQAIDEARQTISGSWYDNIDEETIYAQIASPEFRLYEAMIFSQSSEELSVRPQPYQ